MNIITIAVDDMNAFATFKSLYPGVLHTPNIDRLMAEGVTFQNAFAQVALCNPSRTSILTGKDPALTGVHYNTQPWFEYVTPQDTVPAMIKAAGYNTAIYGKVFHLPLALMDPADVSIVCDVYALSKEFWTSNGDDVDETSIVAFPSFGVLEANIEQHGDFINTSAAIEYLRSAPLDQPFNLYLGIFKPHADWIVPQEYFDLYPLEQMALPFVLHNDREYIPAYVDSIINQNAQHSLEAAGQWPAAVQSYFASISFADTMVGRMLDAIEETGHSDDTAVMLWSDHGYHLGDKDTWHKFTLWEEAGRAPLIIKVPGNPNAGQVVSQPVELVDIAPTMLELAGVTATHEMSGRSLLPFIENTSYVDGGVAITTMFGAASIRSAEPRYIRYPEGSEELYDIVADPNSWTNLASDPNYLLAKTSLRIELETALKQDGWQWVSEGIGQPIEGANLMVLAPAARGAVGGPGNDSYFIMNADVAITEQPDNGYDTIYAGTSFTLPPNVEELQMSNVQAPLNLTGNEQDNKIAGFGQLSGLGGNDVLQSTGFSTLEGGEGNDELTGSKSADILVGGPGDDALRGTFGDDRFIGGPGNDSLVGGPGEDWADYSSSPVAIVMDKSGPTVTSSDDTDSISTIEHFIGSDFDDEYRLGAADNKVVVGLGNDTVDGRAGSDTVILPVGPTEVKIIARSGKVDFVYHLDGATYRVTTRRVEFVEFADGTTQLLEKVEQSEPPLGDAPQ